MEWISSAIGAVGELTGIITTLTKKAKTTNIHKKLIIRELRDNLKIFNSVFKNNLSIDKLIDKVANEEIKKGIDDDFDFNKLKKGNIPDSIVKEPRNKKYVGWSAEKLIDKIDEKMEELKNLKELNNGTISNLEKSNVNLMVSNLFYRMKLLARFIGK